MEQEQEQEQDPEQEWEWEDSARAILSAPRAGGAMAAPTPQGSGCPRAER